MSPDPWRPPGLEHFATLGLRLGMETGALEEERVTWSPSHRIIASEFSGENLFDRLTSDVDYAKLQDEVDALREIADLTNTHIQHEAGRFDLVHPQDRIFGRGSGLIMAAFAFPGGSSRFSDGTAGTYYAARELETAIAETQYHEESTLWGSAPCITEKTVIHAELDATLVDVRQGHPSPPGLYDSEDYRVGQAFGGMVRQFQGHGIVYDAVRHRGGECAAIFRPPALRAATPVQTLFYVWDGTRVSDIR